MGIYNKLKCKICDNDVQSLKRHIKKEHNISILEYFRIDNEKAGLCKICGNKTTFKNIRDGFYERCKEHQINSLDNYIRCYGKEIGTERWSESNDKRRKSNSKEQLIAKFGKDKAEMICKKFGTGAQIAVELRKKCANSIKEYNEKSPNRIEYWLKQGYSEEEAKKKLSERQSTFSLEKCILRYGERKGASIWKKRQEKWQQTLKNKTEQEIKEINKRKVVNGLLSFNKGYSKISQELFWNIYNRLHDKFNIYFATKENNNKNNEYIVETEHGIRLLDFYIEELRLCIEYDGYFWHKKRKKEDLLRENEIYKSIPGIRILRITENEYVNKEATIKKCLDFIESVKNEKNKN
jgi:hypothetical protein